MAKSLRICLHSFIDLSTGPAPFESMIGNPQSDQAFLEMLKKETGADTRKAAPKQAARAELSESQIRKLKLRESDVAKVTREGISHLAFHPTSSNLVIATGTSRGTLRCGTWTRRPATR